MGPSNKKLLRDTKMYILPVHHTISNTLRSILAEPNNADFWMKATDSSTLMSLRLPFRINAINTPLPPRAQLAFSLPIFFVFLLQDFNVFCLLVLLFSYSSIFWNCHVYYLTAFIDFVNGTKTGPLASMLWSVRTLKSQRSLVVLILQ